MCKYLKVRNNSYYHWIKHKDLSVLETAKTHLLKRIRILFEENRQIYGSFKIQKMLAREGLKYSRSYVGILMK